MSQDIKAGEDINAGRDINSAGRDMNAGHETNTNIHLTPARGTDTGDIRHSPTGVAVRLDGLEVQFARFAEIQAEEWGRVRAELAATREQIGDMMHANALQRAREDAEVESEREKLRRLEGEVGELRYTLYGNGRLGTARWEKVSRGMATVAILLVLFVLVIVVLQGVQITQVQQQLSIIMEALP